MIIKTSGIANAIGNVGRKLLTAETEIGAAGSRVRKGVALAINDAAKAVDPHLAESVSTATKKLKDQAVAYT